MIKLALIKESKIPADSRVVLTPKQCKKLLLANNNLKIVVQKSENRCFTNEEYESEGVEVKTDIDDCDIFIGVKEVKIEKLISNKTYFFFSHTIKAQSYNQNLLKSIVSKNIELVDYECLKINGNRVIAFGRWAGIVGAYNGLFTYGKKYNLFNLPRAKDLKDYEALKSILKKQKLPAFKIAITGNGRVGLGSIEIMDHADIRRVSIGDFLNKNFDEPVYVQLNTSDLYKRKTDNKFEKQEFYKNPQIYNCDFKKFTNCTDLFINAIYWNEKAPTYFTLNDMQKSDFNIKVIADITCDIAPEASVPSTLKATTINNPVFGFNKQTFKETEPFLQNTIDVMSIDNLPNELARNASNAFGEMFIENVLPQLNNKANSEMLNNATIVKNGDLNKPFEYLRSYLNG